MSSTTNIQNLLVNVFRPVYRYELPPGGSTSNFIPKLEMSNIDAYSGNTISVFTAAVGDASSNVYVGSNAGNVYTAVQACSNVTALGVNAASAVSNVSNSVFLGTGAGAGAKDASWNICVGANTSGNGGSNIRIGSSSTGTGSRNIVLGALTATSLFSDCILMGPGITATKNNQFQIGSFLYGDTSTNWLGIGAPTSNDSSNRLDVSGNTYIGGQLGVNIAPGQRTLDVNGDFRSTNALGTIDFNGGSFTVTAAFKRTLSATAVTQPIIQYGKASGSGGTGNTTVTLPVAYSDSNYVVQVTMGDADPAEMSADVTSSNSFTLYWANGSGGTHSLHWTTFGT